MIWFFQYSLWSNDDSIRTYKKYWIFLTLGLSSPKIRGERKGILKRTLKSCEQLTSRIVMRERAPHAGPVVSWLGDALQEWKETSAAEFWLAPHQSSNTFRKEQGALGVSLLREMVREAFASLSCTNSLSPFVSKRLVFGFLFSRDGRIFQHIKIHSADIQKVSLKGNSRPRSHWHQKAL